jgi:DNA-binding XRE family transcriptional regulator
MSKHEFRKLRKTAGVTRAQMAALIGVHPVTVKRWEAGTCCMRPTSEKLIRQLVARDFSLARAAAKLPPARKRPR